MQIKELMKQPYVIDKDISLVDAAKLMSFKDIGSLLFVSKGKAKGIITGGDLLKNFGKDAKVSEIMSKDIVSISYKDNLSGALTLMKKNKVKRLPVIDDSKKLVGIISLTDIALSSADIDGEFFFD